MFARYAFRERVRTLFETYDLLLSPVLPVASLDVGLNRPAHHGAGNPLTWVSYTYPFTLTGQPAATVCAGFGDDGMPIGLQVVGRSFGEYDVVRAVAAFEQTQPAGYNTIAGRIP